MAEDSFQEKTEPASDRKREEARRKGKIARSVELNSALVLLFGLLVLYVGGGALASGMSEIARSAFMRSGNLTVNAENLHALFGGGMVRLGMARLARGRKAGRDSHGLRPLLCTISAGDYLRTRPFRRLHLSRCTIPHRKKGSAAPLTTCPSLTMRRFAPALYPAEFPYSSTVPPVRVAMPHGLPVR